MAWRNGEDVCWRRVCETPAESDLKKRPVPQKTGDIGPNIVRAWCDTVINPLLEWLEHEQQLLAAENWTWRVRPGALEAIRQAHAYVDYDARPNLEQFEQLHPQIQRAMDSHDRNVVALTEKCRHVHQALRASEELETLFRRVTSPESLRNIGRDLRDLFGAYAESDHLDLLAEYIVNSTGELPSHYTTAPLWNRYRGDLLAIRARPQCQESLGSGPKDWPGDIQGLTAPESVLERVAVQVVFGARRALRCARRNVADAMRGAERGGAHLSQSRDR